MRKGINVIRNIQSGLKDKGVSRSRLIRMYKYKESHNILCSLFLFDFDAKRKSRTEKEKHERLNGSSHQVLCPRTPIHVITRKTSRAECGAACRINRLSAGLVGRLGVTFNARHSEQIGYGLEQSDVVIPNTTHQCHPELVSGSQKLRRFRNTE